MTNRSNRFQPNHALSLPARCPDVDNTIFKEVLHINFINNRAPPLPPDICTPDPWAIIFRFLVEASFVYDDHVLSLPAECPVIRSLKK